MARQVRTALFRLVSGSAAENTLHYSRFMLGGAACLLDSSCVI